MKYIDIKEKIEIICSKHGTFKQTPEKHLIGQGCPLCSGKMKKTTKQFIEEAKLIHKNKYNYSLVKYENNKIKVDIICSIHGRFKEIKIY